MFLRSLTALAFIIGLATFTDAHSSVDSKASAPVRVTGSRVVQPSGDSTAAERHTNHVAELGLQAARSGHSIQSLVEELQKAVAAEMLNWPNACAIRARLVRELEDLRLRAANFRAHEEEMRLVQTQIVLARYENAVRQITLALKNGNLAEDIALKALYTLRIDAFEYLQSLGMTSIREQLQEAITTLIARGTDAMERAEAARETYEKLYRLRLESALAVLKARLAARSLTKEDYLRIQDELTALESLRSFGQPWACGT